MNVSFKLTVDSDSITSVLIDWINVCFYMCDDGAYQTYHSTILRKNIHSTILGLKSHSKNRVGTEQLEFFWDETGIFHSHRVSSSLRNLESTL